MQALHTDVLLFFFLKRQCPISPPFSVMPNATNHVIVKNLKGNGDSRGKMKSDQPCNLCDGRKYLNIKSISKQVSISLAYELLMSISSGQHTVFVIVELSEGAGRMIFFVF